MAELLTGGGSRSNSGQCTGRGREGSLGELPGGEAKLRWGLAGAGAQQGGRSTVKQESLRGRASSGGARVRGGCSRVGVRAQGVGGSYLWGDGATSACGPGTRARRRFRAVVAWPVAEEGRRGRQVGRAGE
jgi:hypothetical protein